MIDLTISIVSHNSVSPLQACLSSLYDNLKDISYEIYVVDNLCEERATDMLAKEFPQVKALSNSQTLGFGANHNQILRSFIEHSRYVLVLNPDTIVSPGSLQRMIAFLEHNKEVAACSPRLVGKDGPWTFLPKQVVKLHRDALLLALYISNAKNLQQWLEQLRSRKLSNRVSAVTTSSHDIASLATSSRFEAQFCEVILGACMLFRKEALQDVGLFDERFFLYFEEYDWCLRARKHGWKVCLLQNVEIMHLQGYSTTRVDYFKHFGILVESWLAFYRKHAGIWSERSLRLWLTFVAIWNILRWSILYIFQLDRRSQLAAWRVFSIRLLKRIWSKKL